MEITFVPEVNVFTPSINDSNNEIELIQEAINELKSKINNLKSHYKSLLQRSKKNYTEENTASNVYQESKLLQVELDEIPRVLYDLIQKFNEILKKRDLKSLESSNESFLSNLAGFELPTSKDFEKESSSLRLKERSSNG